MTKVSAHASDDMGTMKKNYITLQQKNSPSPSAAAKFFVTSLAGLLCALTIQPVFSADDEYLRALTSEARGSAAPKKIAASDNYLDALSAEADASAKVDSGNTNTADEDRLEMEALLKKEKPTSYKYYKKLKPYDKAKLAEAYRADTADTETKLGHLRKKILDLYFKR